jgi:hypothetical protein
VQVWRVKDLLEFCNGNPKFQSSKIDSFARTWAANADEYLCGDLVPKEALINFVLFKSLAQRDDEPEDSFSDQTFSPLILERLPTVCLSTRDTDCGPIPESNFEFHDGNYGPYCAGDRR